MDDDVSNEYVTATEDELRKWRPAFMTAQCDHWIKEKVLSGAVSADRRTVSIAGCLPTDVGLDLILIFTSAVGKKPYI